MDKSTVFIIIAIIFELLIGAAAVWGILHEQVLIEWEDAIAGKIRKKIRAAKRALTAKWLAEESLIARPLTMQEKEWQSVEHTLGIKELFFWPDMGAKTLFPHLTRVLLTRWLKADGMTVQSLTPRELSNAMGIQKDCVIDRNTEGLPIIRKTATVKTVGVDELLEIINRFAGGQS